MGKIIVFLQKYMWKAMDWMKAYTPNFYKLLKKVLQPVKKTLMFIATYKSIYSIEKNNEKTSKRTSFSILIETDMESVDLKNILNIKYLYPRRCREIVIISNNNVNVSGYKMTKTKIVKNLSEAIMASTGDYICHLEKGMIFDRFGYSRLIHIVSKTHSDIYVSNYTDENNQVSKVCRGFELCDFSKSALPRKSIFGIKVISKDTAIKTRLPREDFFKYLLEASDKANNFYCINLPIVKSITNKKSLFRAVKVQEETHFRRYYYDNKIKISNKIERVFFIAPWMVIGGAEKVLLDLTTEFTNRGIKVDIFCTHKGGDWENKFKSAGASVFISKENKDLDKVKEIQKLLEKNRYDVVHNSNTEFGHYVMPVIKKLKYRPIIIETIHSQNSPLVDIFEDYQSYCDGVISVNEYIKKSLDGRIDVNKIQAIHNGIEFKNEFFDVKEKFKNVEISFIGRMSEEKNPLIFIEVVEKLAKKHTDWTFKIIGDGVLLPKMKQSAKSKGIFDKVTFTGYIENGTEELKTSSCNVITSHTEGLPIVLLESLSMGIPVVSSNVGGIHEVLIDGKNGYLVDEADNVNDYVEKIELIFNDYGKYNNFSKESVLSVKDKTSENMAKNTLDFYESVFKKVDKKLDKVTTIAILSFNRVDAMMRTLKTIYQTTDVPFNIVILDNGSEKETTDYLKKIQKEKDNITCIFEKKNLGCPGGRHKMLDIIKADYIVTIDNDMEVPKFWLRDLIIALEESDKNMGVCVKDIFPWGKVEFTGGTIAKEDSGFCLFNAHNYNKNYNDLTTLEEIKCDWLPGGATLWRGNIKEVAEHSPEYINAFEDFDYSLQLVNKGYSLINCPSVTFIHHHASGFGKKQQSKEAKYISDRNNENGFVVSLDAFFRRTGYVMRNEKIYNLLNIESKATPDEVKEIVNKRAVEIKKYEKTRA